MKIKSLIKLILKIIGGFVLFVILYFLSAFAISSIEVNSDFKACEKDAVEIHLLTSGVHADLVLPFKNQWMDWSKYVSPKDTKLTDSTSKHVAFGWGDKAFFLETKTWDDITFGTTFKALFFLGTGAMHVTYHNQLKESESCVKICISKENYIQLVNYIVESFRFNESGIAQKIEGASYYENDAFYEAKRTYSLFYTCNTWANNGLKSANLKACLWTPFDSSIFKKYQD